MKTNKLAKNLLQAEMLQKTAADLLAPLLCDGAPYDPFAVAAVLRVPVTEAHIPGALGYVESRGGNPQIFLEQNLSPERKRFTLAHELGHVVLMRLANTGANVNLIRYRKSGCPPGIKEDPAEEALCNLFAAELLMPAWEVRILLRERAMALDTVFAVKERFHVSLQAAATRLITLSRWSKLLSISQWDCDLKLPTPKWWIGRRPSSDGELSMIGDFVKALDHRSRNIEISIAPAVGPRRRRRSNRKVLHRRAAEQFEVRVLHQRRCTLVFVCAHGWKDRPIESENVTPSAPMRELELQSPIARTLNDPELVQLRLAFA